MNELNLDKSEWGPGPWQDEPDRIEFESHGFPCLMLRNMHVTGSWCGYVAVPPGHPLHGVPYNKNSYAKDAPASFIDVHGGLTYSDFCREDICHVPKPGEPDNVWWFGFDCAHCDDLTPRMEAVLNKIASFARKQWTIYRDVKFVRKEVIHLAKQLAAYR